MELFESVGDVVDHLNSLDALPSEPYTLYVNAWLCDWWALSTVVRDCTNFKVVKRYETTAHPFNCNYVHGIVICNLGIEDLVRGTF